MDRKAIPTDRIWVSLLPGGDGFQSGAEDVQRSGCWGNCWWLAPCHLNYYVYIHGQPPPSQIQGAYGKLETLGDELKRLEIGENFCLFHHCGNFWKQFLRLRISDDTDGFLPGIFHRIQLPKGIFTARHNLIFFKGGLALSGRLFQMRPIYNLLEPFEFTFPGHVFLWPMDRYRSSLPSTSSPTVSGEAGKPRCEKWILRKAVLTTSEKTWRWETHMQKSHSFMSSHGFMSQSK